MKKNVFDPLVPLKDRREKDAARKVVAQRRALHEAQVERDEASGRLDDWRAYAKAQEDRLYKALCARPVRLRDIEHAQAQVLSMRARESEHRDELDAAEAARASHEQQLEADRAAHRHAARKRDKFVDLAGMLNDEQRAQDEYAAEGEIEEAAQNQRPGASLAQAAP